MKNNLKIAKELVKLAKSILADVNDDIIQKHPELKDDLPGIFIRMDMCGFTDEQKTKFVDSIDASNFNEKDVADVIPWLPDNYCFEDNASFDVLKWIKENRGTWNGSSWDFEGNVDISDGETPVVKNGKFIIKFGKVGGDFYCNFNNLTSLEGCPSSVGGHFSCSFNNLTLLKGCPSSVGKGFYCSNNNLASLKGCPETVKGKFSCCINNNLTSLTGCPYSVGDDFICDDDLKDEAKRLGFKVR